MSKPQRQVNAQKGDAILQAATALFLMSGYEKTTMDAIARKAKVTKQTVYSHYTNKEALFVRMISDLCQHHVHADSTPLSAKKPFDELLYEVGMGLLTLITSPEGMAVTRLVIAEAGRLPKIARLYYENGTQRITQLIAAFLDTQNARGVVAIPDTHSAAAYFFAMLKGQYFLRMTLNVPPIPSRRERKAHVRETVAVFMHMYGGSHPLRTRSRM